MSISVADEHDEGSSLVLAERKPHDEPHEHLPPLFDTWPPPRRPRSPTEPWYSTSSASARAGLLVGPRRRPGRPVPARGRPAAGLRPDLRRPRRAVVPRRSARPRTIAAGRLHRYAPVVSPPRGSDRSLEGRRHGDSASPARPACGGCWNRTRRTFGGGATTIQHRASTSGSTCHRRGRRSSPSAPPSGALSTQRGAGSRRGLAGAHRPVTAMPRLRCDTGASKARNR